MERTLPPTWRPRSEADLAAALREGAFTETPRREAKQQLRGSKDQAKDMASFAIDGGLIVVGVGENKTEGRFELSPIEWKDQIQESPARIAAASCDPPLQVSVDWLKSERESGRGYLLIEVPASPLAPHMVDGVYYGRGDKEKRRLTDAEVERIIQARDTSLDTVRRALEAMKQKDPFPSGKLAHLHLIAVPTRRIPGMFRSWTELDNPQPRLFELVHQRISQETRIKGASALQLPPSFGGLQAGFRPAGGVGIRSQAGTQAEEDYELRFVVREGGDVSLYCGRISMWNDRAHELFVDGLAVKVRVFLDLLAALTEDIGYGGSWDVGVRVDNLNGVRAYVGQRFFASNVHYDTDIYEQVTRVSPLDLERPGGATDRLVGELLRSLDGPGTYRELLSDDVSEGSGPDL